jgi:hypothetical protein
MQFGAIPERDLDQAGLKLDPLARLAPASSPKRWMPALGIKRMRTKIRRPAVGAAGVSGA